MNDIAISDNNEKLQSIFLAEQGVCSLVINNVAKHDCGEYKCQVISNFGEHTSKCILKLSNSKQGLISIKLFTCIKLNNLNLYFIFRVKIFKMS